LVKELNLRDRKALEGAPAGRIYRGVVKLPDFRGRDRRHAIYRTRIREGMRGGPNFAGRLALIEIGCGTGCRVVPVADLSTGQVFEFPIGGEEYSYLNLHHVVNSRAVVAYWQDSERCKREMFIWKEGRFDRSGALDVGASEICFSIVSGASDLDNQDLVPSSTKALDVIPR